MNYANKNITPRVKTHYNRIKENRNNNIKINKIKNKPHRCIICGNEIFENKIQDNKTLITHYSNNYLKYIDDSYPYKKSQLKKSKNYDYITKTQIGNLPVEFKRNYYKIKNDMDSRIKEAKTHFRKNINEFNPNINYVGNYVKKNQGYNVNSFPLHQRYCGTYRKRVYDHDIFNRYNYEM